MIDISSYRKYILDEVPNCTTIAMDRAVVSAVQDFCRDTYIYTDTQDISVEAGTTGYTLTSPDADSVVHAIIKAITGSKLEYINYTYKDGVITLDAEPGQSFTLTFTCVLVPRSSISQIQDLFDQWSDAIKAKAKQKLYLQPNKPWYSPQSAQVMETIYGPAKVRAKRLINRDNSSRSKRVSLPRFI